MRASLWLWCKASVWTSASTEAHKVEQYIITAILFCTSASLVTSGLLGGRALGLWYSEQEEWAALRTTGMQQDWSWSGPAWDYIDLYYKALTS